MKRILMIHAKAQSGKNTIADLLKEKYEQDGLKVLIIAEADYVKFVMSNYYGINDFKSMDGRKRIQHFATEQCRTVNKDIWSNVLTSLLECISNDWDIVIIPDWRFYNEYENMKNKFGDIVKKILIVRPDLLTVDKMNTENRNHESEIELDALRDYDYILNNRTNRLALLEDALNDIVSREK